MFLYQGEDFSQLLDGDPDSLSGRSDGLERQAQAIQDAAAVLNSIASGQMSEATLALQQTATELQTSMSYAYQRYDQTASALKTYAVTLSPIKSQAALDIPRLEDARTRLETAQRAENAAHADQIGDFFSGADAEDRAETSEDLARAQRRVAAAESDINEVLRRLRAAVESKEQAAQAAIAAIEMVLANGADSILDNIAQFFEGVGNMLADIAQWVTQVIADVVAAIDDLWHTILPMLIVATALAIAAVVLGTIGGLVGLLFFGPIGGIIGFGLGVGVVSLLGGFLVNRMLSDILSPDPVVTASPMKQIRDADGNLVSFGLDDAFLDAAYADSIGASPDGGPHDSAGIVVEQIVGADGATHVRVTLPSTQDWQALHNLLNPEDQLALDQLLSDHGASNDLDSNLALMLLPEFQTIYERAVFNALEQAGVDPGPNGDPIMLVGFSQGGIMAGHLAANRPDAYNWDLVMAAGAPIEHMDIPPTTQVVMVQHPDVVSGLDGPLTGVGGSHSDDPNWISISEDAPNGEQAFDAHNATLYNETWVAWMQAHPDEVPPALADFYAGEGDTVTSTVYSWSE